MAEGKDKEAREIKGNDTRGMAKNQWITFAVLMGCAILLALLGWGGIANNSVAVMLGMVPIALALILLGLWQALAVAVAFGIVSMLGASGLESDEMRVFFADPRVSVFPQVLAVLLAWIELRRTRRNMDDQSHSARRIIAGKTAGNFFLLNLVLTLVAIAVFHSDMYGLDGMPNTMLEQSEIIHHIISVRLVLEYAVTVAVSVGVTWLYYRGTPADTFRASMQKTIRKWLSLALTVMAWVIIGMTFVIDTVFERRQAAEEIDITLENMAQDYEELRHKLTYRELLYHLGQDGHTLLLRGNEVMGTDQSMPEAVKWEDLGMDPIRFDEPFAANYSEMTWMCAARQTSDGMVLVGMLPEYEIHVNRNRTVVENLIAIFLIITMIYFIMSHIMKKNVTVNVRRISAGLGQISGGDLDTRLHVMDNLEFAQISNDINDTVQSLQTAQAEVHRRIQADLDLAHAIQMAMLPPTSLRHAQCAIAASYVSAREVGGDFYDYFELPGNRMGLVMADVSGKGIPAAMFMMTAKTIVKNISASCASPAEVLRRANAQLCENNDAEMFVTLWLGFVDLDAKKLLFANAGHNPPILKRGEQIQFLDHKQYKRGLMLGGFATAKYFDNELSLSSNDALVLYTDGITEACNPALELYGDARLGDTVRNVAGTDVHSLLEAISQSVLDFENGMEQADDKTIMVFGL